MIIVTGASGGLGLPLAEDLAAMDTVVGTYHRRRPDLRAGSPVQLYQLDVTDAAAVHQFAEAVAPQASRITLINLAGVSASRLVAQMPDAEWDRVIDVSLKGSFLMSRAFLRLMVRDHWGRIINISSAVARGGVPGAAAYAAAKAGVEGLTATLAHEYARYGVLVNALVLGYFNRGMTEALPEDHRQAVLARIPLRRFGETSELTEAVTYLIRANYVTGARLVIDGGLGAGIPT